MTKEEYTRQFSKNLRKKLNEANMYQQDLAMRTGLSKAVISGYINGERLPGIMAAIRMAHALGCTLDDLIVVDEEICWF